MPVLIRCENIQKSYILGRTELPVIRGISLNIEAGRFVSIIGSSGSGKSTLLHVMSGLDVPQRGQVWFEGSPLFEAEGVRTIPRGRDSRQNDSFAAKVFSPKASAPDLETEGASKRPVAVLQRSSASLESRRNDLLNRSFGFVFQF